jgi:DNA-binding transcriptional regulator GbsR (MarR family)
MTSAAQDPRPPLRRDLESFVERMGRAWEKDGVPRIAGRIFGLLLVSPGDCSLDDLADSLAVSKASVSTDARLLEQLGFLERSSHPGDRRDYYRVAPDLGTRALEIRLAALRGVRRLLAEAPRDIDPEVDARIQDYERLHRYAEEAVEEVLRRWTRDGPDRA